MSVSKIATSAVMALSLVAAPTIASAASAKSVSAARTSAPVAGNKAAGGSGLIIGLLAGAAVIVGIIIAADSGKSATSR